jgi:hypothetical protein
MTKVIKLTENKLKNIVMEAISYEMENREAEEILDFFENTDKNWGLWKNIALQLMYRLDNKELIKWAVENDYYHEPQEDETQSEEYHEGVYTIANWKHDKTLDNLKPGMNVASDVIDELAGSMPPTSYATNCFQPGEPKTSYKGQPLYMTFSKNGGESWKYLGLCMANQTHPIIK